MTNPHVRLTAILALALLLGAGAAVAQTSKTIQVDCTRNGRVQQALGHPADQLLIEIHGLCREKVTVERSNVTLRGADPATDGFTGPVLDLDDPNDRALVTVTNGVKGVRFENLGFHASALRGLEVYGQAVVDLDGCLFKGNWRGVQVNDSGGATAVETDFTDNNLQVVTWSHGLFSCTGCELSSPNKPGGRGVISIAGGRLSLEGSRIDVPGWGAVAVESGGVWLFDTEIISGSWAVIASELSEVWVRRETASTPPEIYGSITADTKSLVLLLGVVQKANPRGNYLSESSTLSLYYSALKDDTVLSGFSNGFADAGSEVGSMQCNMGGDFYCDPGVTPSSSSCGQCPVP